MPETTPSPRSGSPATNPPQLTVAASLVAVQGLVLLCLGVAEAFHVVGDRAAVGLSTALFFTIYAVLLLAGARALTRREGWARGPVLITQLIALGLAWNIRDEQLVAIVLAVSAIVTLAAMLSPATIAALLDEGDLEAD